MYCCSACSSVFLISPTHSPTHTSPSVAAATLRTVTLWAVLDMLCCLAPADNFLNAAPSSAFHPRPPHTSTLVLAPPPLPPASSTNNHSLPRRTTRPAILYVHPVTPFPSRPSARDTEFQASKPELLESQSGNDISKTPYSKLRKTWSAGLHHYVHLDDSSRRSAALF